MVKRVSRGFTIVELLIVIVVIGILAAIVVVAYGGVQTRARVQQVNSDLSSLTKSIHVARITTNKVLKDITLSSCTHCGSQATYEQALDRISAAAGTNLNGLKKGNPWGYKYVLDENELENLASNAGCNKHTIGAGSGIPADAAGIIVPVIPTFTC